jgi:hypothetical protein
MGNYTRACGSNFNGFESPAVENIWLDGQLDSYEISSSNQININSINV